jgi:hypothetical protein
MAQWSDASNTNTIEHSSWDVNLADFDPNYDPTYDLEANCPMCRTRTAAAPDNALARQLEQKYPVTYAERRVEEEEERGSRVGRDGFEGVMILIGNKHRLIRNAGDNNEHDWTFFVRTSRPDLIKEVHIYLVCSHLVLREFEEACNARQLHHDHSCYCTKLTYNSIPHSDNPTLLSENHLMSSKLGAGEPSSFVPRSYSSSRTIGLSITLALGSRLSSSSGPWTSRVEADRAE